MLHQGKMHMKFTAEKSLPPSLTDLPSAILSGKSPKAFWNRQMTASQNNLSQQLPDH